MSYPTTLSDFINRIFHALSIPTGYWAQFPYNLGYKHADGTYTFDCVNLIKAILNGWDGTNGTDTYIYPLPQTGDCNEWGLITQCRGMSSDFTTLNNTSVLYMGGHIGCYVGEFTRGGKTYNTIECTAGSFGDGVIASYVDSAGRRLECKGSVWQIGTWTYHGLMTTWLDYDTEFVDPGQDTDPINPGGGNVEPPGWENPNMREHKFKWYLYTKRRN